MLQIVNRDARNVLRNRLSKLTAKNLRRIICEATRNLLSPSSVTFLNCNKYKMLGKLFEAFSAFRATDENINDLIDDIVGCGYTGKVSVDKKDLITRAVVLHSTMRLVPMLEHLRKGLRLYGLLQVMETHPGLCLPLFVPGEDDRVGIHFLYCLN
ncbi:hypothetical protein AMECASPLE_038551 [Ameca splendens]|uniref:Uncharacterized protein n=1 Tax=Ameca splendens TaxID=208324 RepID=A0ABV1AEL2_9TELE